MSDLAKVNIKMIQHLFPRLRRKDDYQRLQIDSESLHFISTKDVAHKITEIVSYHLNQLQIDPREAVITDATAGVGGDTLSFAHRFFFVNAIEMDPMRVSFLKNNLMVYRRHNVRVIEGDCLTHLLTLPHNVIFFDPPWGGSEYKKHQNLKLALGDRWIEEIVNDLINPQTPMKSAPELIVIKIPKNFDLQSFFQQVTAQTIHFYQLKKMDILVVENQHRIHNSPLQVVPIMTPEGGENLEGEVEEDGLDRFIE